MIAFALCGGRIATLRSNFSKKSRRWGEVEAQCLSPVFDAHFIPEIANVQFSQIDSQPVTQSGHFAADKETSRTPEQAKPLVQANNQPEPAVSPQPGAPSTSNQIDDDPKNISCHDQ